MEQRTKSDLNSYEQILNTEEVHEIITAVPSWILRVGCTLILGLILSVVLISSFIKYPDVIKVNLKIYSSNAPKGVFVKQAGKIVKIFFKEGSMVEQNQILAFMESTAEHRDVLELYKMLTRMSSELKISGVIADLHLKDFKLGELQSQYLNFHQQYFKYISLQRGGYYTKRRAYLETDLKSIGELHKQIMSQRQIQEKEFANVENEFESYKKLFEKNVISRSEYKLQENKYLSARYPLAQNITALLNNNSEYISKEKEILELEQTIQEEQSKFIEVLKNMITEIDRWTNLYILKTPITGKLSYGEIIQENQTVNLGEEIFIISSSKSYFFGEVFIPQYNMGKIKIGQDVLIKMHGFPFEEYGIVRGKMTYISDVAIRDSLFIGKVSFRRPESKKTESRILLKNGMQADAEIITQESSLLRRFVRGLTRTSGIL